MKKQINILALTNDPFTTNLLFSEKYPSLLYGKKIFLREDKNIAHVNFKKRLKKNNFNIFTLNKYNKKKPKIDIEIHFYSNIKKMSQSSKLYLVLPEHHLIDKDCNYDLIIRKYDKIFTNIKKFIDNKFFFKINWPLKLYIKKPFSKYIRKSFCIIASNKTLNSNSVKSGYAERNRIIKWFKKNKPGELSLYGNGWDRPFFDSYYLNRVTNYFFLKFNLSYKFLNNEYKGICNDKIKTLKKYNFTFCIENVVNEKGYNTCQVIDAMKALSIPVYFGRPDLKLAIPENCFIDYKKFSSIEKLYNYLSNMSQVEINKIQTNIFNFCNYSNYKEFNEFNYSEILLKHLKNDTK